MAARGVGVVVPIWYPPAAPPAAVGRLLAACLEDGALAPPARVLAVLDGAPHWGALLRRLATRLGTFTVLESPRNEGKGAAVARGIRRLLADPGVRYVVVRDHDNDHLANDARNLVRLTAQIEADTGAAAVAVIGRRASMHRHMGFVRGEVEAFLNEVVMEAARYAAARVGRALALQYTAAYEPPPDLHSGFKCYTRAAAGQYLRSLARAARLAPGLDLRRHGAEIPVLMDLWLAGAPVGEIQRLACARPPFTTFDPAARLAVSGAVLVWALRRARAPAAAARQWMRNAAARRLLGRERDGARLLAALEAWVLARLPAQRTARPPARGPLDVAEYF